MRLGTRVGLGARVVVEMKAGVGARVGARAMVWAWAWAIRVGLEPL